LVLEALLARDLTQEAIMDHGFNGHTVALQNEAAEIHVLKRLDDQNWLLRYFRREYILKHQYGLVYYAASLAEPWKLISGMRLSHLTHEGVVGRGTLTNKEARSEGMFRGKLVRGSLLTLFSRQAVTDGETLAASQVDMEYIAAELTRARELHDDGKVLEWQKQLYAIGDYLMESLNQSGRILNFSGGDMAEQARSAVAKAMQRARQKLFEIDPELEGLATYLRTHVIGRSKGFIFEPGPTDTRWEASWVLKNG
jgi:hypothetical protein